MMQHSSLLRVFKTKLHEQTELDRLDGNIKPIQPSWEEVRADSVL